MIFNFHGFTGCGHNEKYNLLVGRFGRENVYSPDLPVNPSEMIKLIDSFIYGNSKFPLIFVGTSLGGFWANYASQRWDAPCILINPCTEPSRYLSGRISEKDAAEYKENENIVYGNTNGALINLFLAADDNVIPYKDTLSIIPHFASSRITLGGGHRYIENFDLVLEKISELLK